jgi:flagellar export protein FliJ
MKRRQKTVSKIIEIKTFTKEQIEAEVKKAHERLDVEQKKQSALELNYRKMCAELTGKQMNGTLVCHEVDLYTLYLKHLGKQIELQQRIVAIRNEELETLRTAMVEAYKEQRLFEILHDKIVKERNKETDKREQKEMDSSFLSRNVKK